MPSGVKPLYFYVNFILEFTSTRHSSLQFLLKALPGAGARSLTWAASATSTQWHQCEVYVRGQCPRTVSAVHSLPGHASLLFLAST